MPMATKALASIMLLRVTPIGEMDQPEQKVGVRRSRGRIDQSFTLHRLSEMRHIHTVDR